MSTDSVSPLRQRMIEDMNARKLCAGTQRGHIRSCRQFAAFLKRSPDTATLEDIRRFQLHLAGSGARQNARSELFSKGDIMRLQPLVAAEEGVFRHVGRVPAGRRVPAERLRHASDVMWSRTAAYTQITHAKCVRLPRELANLVAIADE